jgi:hypothetical protein
MEWRRLIGIHEGPGKGCPRLRPERKVLLGGPDQFDATIAYAPGSPMASRLAPERRSM